MEDATANGVLSAIDNVLQTRAGVSVEVQRKKMVNHNLDCAAVNMGVYFLQ